MRIRRALAFLVVASVVIAVGCSADSSSRKLGESCDGDDQCTGGLACKQNFVGNQCTSKTCTKACTGDAECQAVDPKGKCFQGCGNEKICMLTP